VTSDEVEAGRPYPYMIEKAMERTGVSDPARVLVAGDTVVDARAGAKAGAGMVCGVLTGKLDEAGFNGTSTADGIGSVADLPAILLKG